MVKKYNTNKGIIDFIKTISSLNERKKIEIIDK
jgi:hypothetical protein